MLPLLSSPRFRVFGLLATICVLTISGHAQNYLYATGTPTFSTAQPVELGFINVANGNLHLEIPLASPAQRGSLAPGEELVYDSRIWQPVSGVWSPTNAGGSMLGWRFENAIGPFYIYANTTECDLRNGQFTLYDFSYTEPNGTPRTFSGVETEKDPTNCDSGNSPTSDGVADDGSGYHLYVTNYTSAVLLAPDGTQVYPTLRDTNGNSFSTDGNGNLVDTLGRKPVAYSTNGSNQNYYDVLGSDGATHKVTVTYGNVSATSNFGQLGVSNQTVNQNAIQRIDLPDGSHYSFGYDSWGELNSITLPTGGQITYNYTTFTDVYGNENRWASSRISGGGTWSYSPLIVSNSVCQAVQTSGTVNGCQQITVTKPGSEKVVYTFSLNGGAWNSQADYYSASGAKVATNTQFFNLSNTCGGCVGAAYVQKMTETTSLPTVNSQTLTKQTQYLYDNIHDFNVTTIKEWNFTTGSPGPSPDRETDIAYENATPYISANILNRPTQVTTYAGPCCATPISQTNYTYDTATGLISQTGITHHDDTNFGTGNVIRGNVTQIQNWIGGSNYWTTTLTYDTTGQLRQSEVNNNSNYITSFSYADSFYNDNGVNPPAATTPSSGATNAYATSITLPIIGAESVSYYLGTGKTAFGTDQNGATSYAHYLDPLDRPTESSDPIGGWQLITYASETQQDIYTALTSATPSTGCTSCRHDQVLLDSLARVSNTPVVSDPDGQVNTGTSYDSNGRVSSTLNPYRSNTDPTYGSTGFSYDGLDRVTQIARPDGNTVVNTYGVGLPSSTSSVCGVTAFPSVTTDEAGNKRQYWNDGFGRLLEVDEPDTSGNFTIATCYQYDLLNNLQTITQRGGDPNSADWRVRSYGYDGLSRVTQETTPEVGTVTYSYTSNGSPCSPSANLPCSRTDPRNITTTYTYDALSRLTGKSYSDTTPAVAYYYDQSSYNGLTITNGKGRRTGMSDGTGATAWAYDAAGNVLTKRQTINGVTNSISYTYNLDSSVASLTSPNGHTYTYSYSNALRPVSLSDSGHGITYVANAHYAAPGELTSAQHGLGLAITETNQFNSRLEPTILSAASSAMTDFSLSYSWVLPNGKNNASVYRIQNNRDNTRSLQYSYDPMNRLATAGTYNATTWGDAYVYDNWGNLLQKNPTQGTGESLQVTTDVHNHINTSGFKYDAAGNLTWDGANALKFDAENHMNPATGYVYSYDGDDLRVEKNYQGSITYYWYDDNAQVISTTGVATNDYVYFAGRRIAFEDSAGNQHYYWSDHLGSAGVLTNSNGSAIQWEADYYPFGTKRVITNNLTNYYLFTGYQFDYETGYNYAIFREQSPNLGRFMSPDPLGLAAADVSNPQSLNRYSYVLNNPLRYIDPTGLDCVYFSDDGTSVESLDQSPDAYSDCGDNGGTWVNGTVDLSSVSYDPGTDTFNISSTDQGTGVNYNSTVAANGQWYDPSQGQLVNVQNGVLSQSAFNWQIQSRPLTGFPGSGTLGIDHYYFYDTVTGQSVGLGPTKTTATGPVPGKWETGESCQKNSTPVPGWLQQCVNQQIQNRGNAPNYCTLQGQVNVNSQCMNCIGWVDNTLQKCYNQEYPNRH